MKHGVTFVIPSVNRPTLQASIDSLIMQSNPNWQCVIVYDGVDGSDFDDPRIRTIRANKLGGFGQTGMAGLVRNIGIETVDTEWVAFLDDDDTLMLGYVEKLLSKYKDFDAVVFRMKYQNGAIIPLPHDSRMYFCNVGISFAYKMREPKILFDSNRDGEDFDMVQKLQGIFSRFIVADEVMYNVRH